MSHQPPRGLALSELIAQLAGALSRGDALEGLGEAAGRTAEAIGFSRGAVVVPLPHRGRTG